MVKIVSDSTCDLSQELIEKYSIRIVPLYIEKDGEYFKDSLEITPEDIFAHVSSTGKLCRTAAVNVADYQQVFAEELKNHDGIVHFTISSDMSSCYQNAVLAAKDFENVYVIDSTNLSTGIGQLVIEAALLAQQGKSAKEIFETVEPMREKLDVSFILDTLDYLAKGGRCSSLMALSAGLLGIKPCIEVVHGKMGVGKKYRGKLGAVLINYVKDRLTTADDLDLRRIFITYTGYYDDVLPNEVKKAVLECAPFEEVLLTRAGGTIANHCGPNCLGILYFHKNPRP